MSYYYYNGKCEVICPEKTFLDIDNLHCHDCVKNCKKCLCSKTCNECQDGFYLKDGICQLDCKTGYFKNILTKKCDGMF